VNRRVRTRAGAIALLAGAVLLLAPSAASADPAGPTNYDSQVTSVEPPIDGLEVEILGGDAYVQLTVPPGSTATVSGYADGELYLRFLEDGTVERNEASPTRWINDERYGAEVPPEASADAPPRWEPIASGGTYAWHDHRVHWMSPEVPDQVDASSGERQRVLTWSLGLTVDDEPVEVSGELDYLPAPSPVVPGLVLLLVLAGGTLLALKRPALVPLVALTGAVAAGVVGLAAVVGLPPGADREPALVVLPGVALVLLGVGVVMRGRPGTGPRLVGALAGLPLVVWGVLLARGLVSAIVPTALPSGVARVLIALVLAAGLASLIAAARLATASPAPQPGG
jgi:hypothetical protein